MHSVIFLLTYLHVAHACPSFFEIGQPMAMLLYTIDYWEHNQEMVEVIEEKTPKLLKLIASIFGASSKL